MMPRKTSSAGATAAFVLKEGGVAGVMIFVFDVPAQADVREQLLEQPVRNGPRTRSCSPAKTPGPSKHGAYGLRQGEVRLVKADQGGVFAQGGMDCGCMCVYEGLGWGLIYGPVRSGR